MLALWLALASAAPQPCHREGQTQYTVDAVVEGRVVTVQQTIGLTNTHSDRWDDVRLRLPEPPAKLRKVQVLESGRALEHRMGDPALQVLRSVEPGASIEIVVRFEIVLPIRERGVDDTVTLARLGPWTLLGDWLPMVVPWADGRWQIRTAADFADHSNFDPADFRYSIRGLEDHVIAAPGTDGYAPGLRELAIFACQGCTVLETQTSGPTIRLISEAPTDQQLQDARSTVEKLTAQIGSLPYTHLDLAEVPGANWGVEFPQVMLISGSSPWLQAHELGHQWFYREIGRDQVHRPWIDESLATWAAFRWYEVHYPVDHNHLLNLLGSAAKVYPKRPIAASLHQFTKDEYNAQVYIRPSLFWDRVAQAEPEAMAQGLRAYYRDLRCKQAGDTDLIERVKAHAGDPDALDALYRQQILGGD